MTEQAAHWLGRCLTCAPRLALSMTAPVAHAFDAARTAVVRAANDVCMIRFPGAWCNRLFALFIGGLLAYGAVLAWHYLTGFDLVNRSAMDSTMTPSTIFR